MRPRIGSQARNIEDFRDVGELIGAGHGGAQKTPARAAAAEEVQGIEAGQATEPEHQEGLGKDRGRNLGLDPMIHQGLQLILQAEDLLPVGDRSRQQRLLLPLLQTCPRLLADRLEQLARLLIMLHPSCHVALFGSGDVFHARAPLLAHT